MLDRTLPLHDEGLPALDADAIDPIDPAAGTPFQDPFLDADATDDPADPFTDDDAHDDELDAEPTTDDPWDDDDGDTAPGLTHWWHGNLG
ncbi:MAG: hypothetical protein RI554_11320 [Trueperaceae bacterium]|nr:hypothetical protein [Trueperaceae bacterium]